MRSRSQVGSAALRFFSLRDPADRLRRSCLSDLPIRPERPAAGVAELGGANSCFLEALDSRFDIRQCHVFDSKRYGLSLLSKRTNCGAEVVVPQRPYRRTWSSTSVSLSISTAVAPEAQFALIWTACDPAAFSSFPTRRPRRYTAPFASWPNCFAAGNSRMNVLCTYRK